MSPQPSLSSLDGEERRVAMVEALNRALEVFCSLNEDSFDEVVSSAMRAIAEATGVDRILIDRYIESDEGNSLKSLYRWDKRLGGLTDERIALLPDSSLNTNWLGMLLRGGYISRQVSDSVADEKVFLESLDAKSVFITPIFMRGKLWGCVAFQNLIEEACFLDSCIDLMQSFARLCATAVMSDEMEREAIEQHKFTRIIFDASPICLTMFDDNQRIIDCNKATLKMFGVSEDFYLNNFYALSPEYQPDGSKSVDKSNELVKRALNGEKLVFEWTHLLPSGEVFPTEITLFRMDHNDRYIVLAYVYDLRTLRQMENNIIRLEAESEKIYYDPLTGIYNRRFFDVNVDRVMKTLSRSGGVLSMMMVDIDFFKRFNDAYGHTAGDVCLKMIAATLSGCVTRTDDFVVRYGGEEFAVVLPNTDEVGACMIAEKMLENVRACKIKHEDSSVSDVVTVSIGVTTGMVRPRHRADDFILRADELLYKSKQGGRNRFTYNKL